jgi:hypothetical protein
LRDCACSGIGRNQTAYFSEPAHDAEEKRGSSVVYRAYSGIRAALYRPVQPEDIKGFKIVNQVFPSGRVNNTCWSLNKG